MEVPSSADNNPWPHLSHYFRYVSRVGDQILYYCTMCVHKQTNIKAHISSLNNLKQHIRRTHESEYEHFQELVTKNTSRGKKSKIKANIVKSESNETVKKMRFTSIEESFEVIEERNSIFLPHVIEECVEDSIVKFFTTNMIPLHVVESDSFGDLIKILNPSQSTMSIRELDRRISDKYLRLKCHLIKVLDKIDWVATTADCWSVDNKSYLGMTVHWLEPATRSRMQAMLACMPVNRTYSYDTLAQTINNTLKEFCIENKVTRIIIDDGCNFVKEFSQRGVWNEIISNQSSFNDDLEPDVANLVNDTKDEDIHFISLDKLFKEQELKVKTEDILKTLPAYLTCAAHIFNLIASKDIDAAIQNSYLKVPFINAMTKACALWNQQFRDSDVEDLIYSEIGRKLILPNNASWKSTYDAIVVLNEIFEAQRLTLHKLMIKLTLDTFEDQDVTILNQYTKVLEPIVHAIDQMNGQFQPHIGSLLPTITTTIYNLQNIKSNGPLNCTPLADALLSGITRRFGPLLDDKYCQLAAAFHPNFRLLWLETYDISQIAVVKQLMEEVIEKELEDETTENSKKSDSLRNDVEINMEDDDNDSSHSMTKINEITNEKNLTKQKAKSLVNIWLNMKPIHSLDNSAFLEEKVLVNLFIKYNTPICSSAAVKQFFNMGKDMLPPKQSSMSDEHFSMFMFINGNTHLY